MCLLHILQIQSKTKRRGFYHSINECLRNAGAWCRISCCQKADIFESLDSALVGMALQMYETSLLNQTYKMTLFQLNCLKTLISQLVQVSCLMLINHLKCLWQKSQELLRIFREKFQIFQTATRLLKFLWIILNAALFFIFKFIRENKFKCNFWFLVAVINLWTKDTFKTISIAN